MTTREGYPLLVEAVQIVDKIDNNFFGSLGQRVLDFNLGLRIFLEANKLHCEQGD
jgi:hypothetical protein